MVELPLLTPRLRLRTFVPEDAHAMHEVLGDPEVMRYVGHGAVTSEVATAESIAAYAAGQRQRGYSFWAVEERASGELVGDAGLWPLLGTGPEVELGYTLGRRWWGRGFATEAAAACRDAAFRFLGVDEVLALAEEANVGSVRVLEKLGGRRTGTRIAYGREHLVFRIGRPE